MASYLKLFETHTQYETFIGGGGDTPFVKPNVSYCTEENEVHYNPFSWADEYLTFVALEDGTFTFAPSVGNVISYSIDNGDNWIEGNSVELTKDSKVLWRGEMTPTRYNGVGTFSSTGRFNVQGNVMSLLFGFDFKGQTDLTGKNYAFWGLFSSNSNLVNVQNLSLSATTLADSCYFSMFEGCTSLVNAPTLPATTLAENCYASMFEGCTKLVNAPELPATTLVDYCYVSMFNGCTSLTTAPELPATTLVDWCYGDMFYGCTSLETAPELPATTLAYYCYYEMFYGCTKLNYIKCLVTKISASNCLSDWVSDVASTGTFVKAASMTSWTTGTSGIPDGWTVQDVTV